MRDKRDEIRTLAGIIVSRQADGTAVMKSRVIGHRGISPLSVIFVGARCTVPLFVFEIENKEFNSNNQGRK
jgi:hypothetical protein